MLSACGSTSRPRRHSDRHATTVRAGDVHDLSDRPARRRCCPNRPAHLPVGVRTVPSVSPARDHPRLVSGPKRDRYRRCRSTSRTRPPPPYGLPAKQLKGAVPRASVERRAGADHRPRAGGRAHAGLGQPDGLVDRARAGPREQRLRRRDRRPDPRHRRPEHAAGRHRQPGSTAGPGRRGARLRTGPRIATFAGPVDPNKIAVGGHSIAGAIAFQVGPHRSTRARRVRPRRMAPRTRADDAGHRPRAHDRRVRTRAGTKAIIGRTADAVTVQARRCNAPRRHRPPVPRAGLGASRRLLRLGTIGCAGTTTTNAVVLRFLDTVLRDGKPTPSAAALTRGLPRRGVSHAPAELNPDHRKGRQ